MKVLNRTSSQLKAANTGLQYAHSWLDTFVFLVTQWHIFKVKGEEPPISAQNLWYPRQEHVETCSAGIMAISRQRVRLHKRKQMR